MSFYLGKDGAGSSILHITNGVTTEANMKVGEISSTTFHSGSSLSSAIVIPVTLYRRTMYREFSYYNIAYGGEKPGYHFINGVYLGMGLGESESYANFNYFAEIPINSVYVYNIPSAYASTYISSVMAGDNNILYLDSNYKPVAEASSIRLVGSTQNGISFKTYLTPGVVGFMELHKERAPTLGTISYIVILKPNYYPKLYGSCIVNSSGIYIGGADVFAGKILLTNSPNAEMPIFDNLGIITTTTTNQTGIQISSNSSITTINKGGKTLFDSRYTYYRNLNPKSEFTITTPSGVRDILVYVCDINGDYVSIDTSASIEGYGYLTKGYSSGAPTVYPVPAGTYSCIGTTRILVKVLEMRTSSGLIAGFHLYYLQIQNKQLYYYCKTLSGYTQPYGTIILKIKVF